jgi:hypothetical protein
MSLSFEPNDPFPLLPIGSMSYREAQEHAKHVDRWLGLRVDEIEAELSRKRAPEGQEFWLGLSAAALQTPYIEIRQMLESVGLPPGSRVLDLGAGYGRMGFVMGAHYPDSSFLGLEIVHERLEEGNRCLRAQGHPNAMLEWADLASSDFQLPVAEVFFLYDFGSRSAIVKILGELKTLASRQEVVVIGRGRATRDAIERDEPWLSQVVKPRHFGNFSIYRSG